MPRQLSRLLTIGSFAAVALLAGGAQAHHAMDGVLPSGFGQGFVSGLAHPVIGLDHLAFLIAAGVAAGAAGLGLWLPILFVAASIGGVVLHLQAVDLPVAEAVIAVSVVLAGALLARGGRGPGSAVWAAILAVAGLFHGYAYGESIVGAEPTALWAYLAGLAVVQSAIAVGAALIASRSAWTLPSTAPRLTGAAVFGVGLAALAGQVVG